MYASAHVNNQFCTVYIVKYADLHENGMPLNCMSSVAFQFFSRHSIFVMTRQQRSVVNGINHPQSRNSHFDTLGAKCTMPCFNYSICSSSLPPFK